MESGSEFLEKRESDREREREREERLVLGLSVCLVDWSTYQAVPVISCLRIINFLSSLPLTESWLGPPTYPVRSHGRHHPRWTLSLSLSLLSFHLFFMVLMQLWHNHFYLMNGCKGKSLFYTPLAFSYLDTILRTLWVCFYFCAFQSLVIYLNNTTWSDSPEMTTQA